MRVALLILAVILCISLSSSTILKLTNKSGSNSLRSFHGTFLSANADGTVRLSYNVMAQEKWKWVWIEGNDYVWVSYHGTYLSGNQDGTVKLAKQPQEWERWTKVKKDGSIYWRSFHGTYLSGEMSMKVGLRRATSSWEQWEQDSVQDRQLVFSEGPGELKSFHGTFLQATFYKMVRLNPNLEAQQKWTLLWLGENKYAWKSSYHTYLSARPDKTVILTDRLQGWETWLRQDQNGKWLWKSAHGTYLSGKANLTVNLQKVPKKLEQWTEMRSGGENVGEGRNSPLPPGTNLRVINNCPYTIWPGLDGLNNDNTRIFGNKSSANPAGFELPSGQQKLISLSKGAIGVRVWARLQCSYQTNDNWPDVKTRFLCQVGECGNTYNKWDGTCYKSGGQGGNTLAEFTMDPDGRWTYDISLVDGYTLPVTVSLFGKLSKVPGVKEQYNCKITSCFPDQNFDQCPPELKKFQTGTEKTISCYSISQAINDNQLKSRTPALQRYFNDPQLRSHIECSCGVGSCAGKTANEVAKNILPGTGFCCSPYNPIYQDPRIRSHICYPQDKPKPLNNFGGGKRYDQIFKSICPHAYSWEFDDSNSTYECQGKEATIQVKFC